LWSSTCGGNAVLARKNQALASALLLTTAATRAP
jgi:hypothetical protein